ncbi:SDR family oxidoreductase [Streptacidiphilus sp. 4-A2]|nr:SDR family oxidoreductase [Streptacidiphilus sp. 4-A2]
MTGTAELHDRTALVTGGSRGIGRAISLRLAGRGALVAVHYGHNRAAAEETVSEITGQGGRAFTVHAELGVPGDAEALWTAFDKGLAGAGGEPGVDILVNNAGITLPKPITEVTEEAYDQLFAVNVKAPFFLIKHGLGRLRDGGRIINISSGVTRIAIPHISAYAMTKGALETLTLALAEQLGPRGITVNSVAPGFTFTEINPTLQNQQVLAAAASASAFNRVGRPSDIADVVAFVAGDDARWVTGQCLDATGGAHLGLRG